ncbi:FabA/FabZ family ACP-dehydratase [Sphaerimonospora mesophila]|uniref:FabA/FabZ family ACP-dehydratase n=1 Tax=Sphaerimonospora mesophila TaxID=37483 RepID=UPI0006E3FF20
MTAPPLTAVEHVEWDREPDGRLTVRAGKTVTSADPYMTGHFPGLTVYPGVFILESVEQAAAAALGGPLRLTRLRSVRFLSPLLDGDAFRLTAVITPGDDGFEVDARCERDDGSLVATVRVRFAPEVADGR